MNPTERDTAAALVWLAKAMCSEYYLGYHEAIGDRRNEVYKAKIEDNWHTWIPRAKVALEQALPSQQASVSPSVCPNQVTVPGWVLDRLLRDAQVEIARAADALGKSGHAASEQMPVEYQAIEVATNALVGVTISPPGVKF